MITKALYNATKYLIKKGYKKIAQIKRYMEKNNYATFKAMRDTIVPEIRTAKSVNLSEAVAIVNEPKCIGCELCMPIGHCYAIEMKVGKGWEGKNKKGIVALVNPYKCTGCSTCFDLCPTDAFKWTPVPKDRTVIPV